MFSKLFAVSTLAIVLQANALKIYQPSSTWWWQTGDQALLAWECTDRVTTQYTVMVTNPNINLLTAPTPLVAIQNNDQCTINLVPNLNPGTGYVVHLADIFNSTHYLADSEPFEVKAKGSPYPSSSTTLAAQSTSVGSSSDTNSTTTNSTRSGDASTVHVAASAVGLVTIGLSAFLA